MRSTIAGLLDQYEKGELSRRQLVGTLATIAGWGAMAGAARPASSATFGATRLDHVALDVTDVARSRDFYVEHLGLSVASDNSPHSCFLDCGPNFVALFRSSSPGLNHYCYAIPDFSTRSVADRLQSVGLEPEIQGRRVYFSDPDGITVQLAQGPPGG